jgi:predicted  nucleic acid-binding Zn-ribbon protein
VKTRTKKPKEYKSQSTMLKRLLIQLLQWEIQRIVQSETAPLQKELQQMRELVTELDKHAVSLLKENYRLKSEMSKDSTTV